MTLTLHQHELLASMHSCLQLFMCILCAILQADDAAMADKKEEVKVLKGGGAAAAGAGLLRYVLLSHVQYTSSDTDTPNTALA
jgi:hypothetical protein